MKCAYEVRCVLEFNRNMQSQLSQERIKEQYQEIIQTIEFKIDYALSHNQNYFFLNENYPDSIFKMLKKMGYKMSCPYEARLNFDNETVKVLF